MIAFEDSELNEWLMRTIEEGPGQFLSALAEAVVVACPEDYSLVRPVLISLKRKYCLGSSLRKPDARSKAGTGETRRQPVERGADQNQEREPGVGKSRPLARVAAEYPHKQ